MQLHILNLLYPNKYSSLLSEGIEKAKLLPLQQRTPTGRYIWVLISSECCNPQHQSCFSNETCYFVDFNNLTLQEIEALPKFLGKGATLFQKEQKQKFLLNLKATETLLSSEN